MHAFKSPCLPTRVYVEQENRKSPHGASYAVGYYLDYTRDKATYMNCFSNFVTQNILTQMHIFTFLNHKLLEPQF